MKKVLLCRIDGFSGGVERHILQLAQSFNRQRYDPVIVPIANHGELERLALEAGLEVEFLPMRNRLDIFGAGKRLVAIAQKHQASLLHSFGIRSNMLAYIIRRKMHIPWIIRLPNINRTDYSNPIQGSVFHWINNYLIGQADALQVISPELEQYMNSLRKAQKNIYLIRNGVDWDDYDRSRVEEDIRQKFHIAENAYCVGSTGRLVHIKGYDLLLKAFAQVIKQISKARLILVGEGPERSPLEAWAKEEGIRDSVVFAGYQADVRPYLKAFDLFVCSSRSEGVPNSILEAMAMQTPVLSTRVGGIESMVENQKEAWLIPPNDINALTEAMVYLLNHAGERERLKENAFGRVKQDYSVDRMVEEVEKMYQEVLDRRGNSS